MKPVRWFTGLALAALFAMPAAAGARGLSVELWTDRGSDAVYQPGDPIQIKARASDDAYLLVYEIDAEGNVHLLSPTEGHSGMVEGRRTYRLPDDERNELIVDSQTGEGYIVAIVSAFPFDDLPWYLRPYNPQAEGVGYYGKPDDEEGITSEGRIVGDPFVAMERIRRRVLRDARNVDDFATAYVNYYVHERVRYPRYLCNDCHRPGRYAWWDGFDPYYTDCRVFDFRVNWSWGWGPRYWFGTVPYFVYVYRDDCPPVYRRHYGSGYWYSSWDGWNRWCDLWGNGGLRRYKSPPPAGYTPPERYREAAREGRPIRALPPGFIANNGGVEKRGGIRSTVPVGRGGAFGGDERGARRGSGDDARTYGETRRPREEGGRKEGITRSPAYTPRDSRDRGGAPPEWRPSAPRSEPSSRPHEERRAEPRNDTPAYERPRQEAPPRKEPDPPRVERSREDRPQPRKEEPRPQPREGQQQRQKDDGGQGGGRQRR